MRFGILGSTEVWRDDGSAVATGGARRRALLIRLALSAGRVVTTEQLIDDIYGEAPPNGVGNALQAQISRLRGALLRENNVQLVEFHPAGYRLAVDPLAVDAHRFERLAAEGRGALAAGDPPRAAALLDEALSLWRGPALADAAGAAFAEAPARRLEELRLSAIEDHMAAQLAQGGGAALAAELQDLVAAHPLRERLRGQLMRVLRAGGRQADALAAFEDGRALLAEELGADPSAELAEIHLAILRGESADASSARTGSNHPTREEPGHRATAVAGRAQPVPAQFTSFVDAEEELARIGALLGTARLVTLTGPGGVGKTRRAVEAAAREPGEVCFAELAPAGAGSDVPQAVLTALGLRESSLVGSPTPDHHPSPADPAARLVAALADRPLLLVLDNCEHVLADAAQLVGRLLSGCPKLRVLATSQETLGITGETLWPVAPLTLPPADCRAQDALKYPSVLLFADRAAAVRPGFTVDDGNVGHVVAVCRALDGMPLAIELAAARMRALPVAEIAGRLDDRFALLARGNRTAHPKHQSLRAVVAWSWDLLDEAEQRLARRFSAFVGGATLSAVRAVCGQGEQGEEVADTLAGLAEKSFIEAVDGGRRYRMVATIRAFAAERLTEAGEREPIQRAHTVYFGDLAQAAEAHLHRAEQLEWLSVLSAEHDNLHAALRWAVDHDEAAALRLVAALSSYWWMRGQRTEGFALSGALLARIGPEPPQGLEEEYVLCVLDATAGGIVATEGGTVEGSAVAWPGPYLDRVEAIAAGLRQPLRWPLIAVLWPTYIGGELQESASILPFLEGCQASPDPWVRAVAHLVCGYLRFFEGDVDGSEAAFAGALEGFRVLGDRWAAMLALTGLATITSWQGDLARTLAITDAALDFTGQLDAAEDAADLLCLRADGLLRGGNLDEAHAAFGQAAEIARQTAAGVALSMARRGLGEVARLRGNLPEARWLCESAAAGITTGWAPGASWRELRVGFELGRIAEAEGDAAQARDRYLRALSNDVSGVNLAQVTVAAEVLASVAMLDGDAERVPLLLGAGTAIRGGREVAAPDVVRMAEAARTAIGEDTYNAAYTRGTSMSRAEALAEIGTLVSELGVSAR